MKGDLFAFGSHQVVYNVAPTGAPAPVTEPLLSQLASHHVHRVMNTAIATCVGGQIFRLNKGKDASNNFCTTIYKLDLKITR